MAYSLNPGISGPLLLFTMKELVLLLFLSLTGGILAFDTCSSKSTACDDSCKNRCGDKPSNEYLCQCNKHCERFGDCCDDYSTCKYSDPGFNEAVHHKKSVTSCEGRCGEKYKKKNTCHCNKKCPKHNNCCADYNELCIGGTSSTMKNKKEETYSGSRPNLGTDISNEEIKAISEKLFQSDHNKAAESDIILNKQKMVQKDTTREDFCDEPLYQFVNEELFKRPTYEKFINLLDNYDRKTGIDETYCPVELKEQEHFLQEVMKTKVMKELYTFFNEKGLYTTVDDFSDDLQKMWFGLYSRSTGEKDSSGFEHVFVGEVKKGKVSGFHSWIRFCHLEKKGMLNYFSLNFDGPWNSYPDVLGKQFDWAGFVKDVGSQFVGSSPEFDFAIYTLCFIARPGKRCVISMDGHTLPIQTYEWTKNTYGNGKRYIGTAYPMVNLATDNITKLSPLHIPGGYFVTRTGVSENSPECNN